MKVTGTKKMRVVFWSLIALVFCIQTAVAINILSEGYRLTGIDRQISGYGSCYYAKANDGQEYFFPTATGVEFQTFVSNKPAGVTLVSCSFLYGNIHTTQDCVNAGGTVYNGTYCRFTSSQCPSGWTSSGYSDYSTNGAMCSGGGVNVACSPSGMISGSLCTVNPGTLTYRNYLSVYDFTCTYYNANYYYGSYQTYENVCGQVYGCSQQYSCTFGQVCGGFPYSCGFGQICGYNNVCGYSYQCSYQYVTHYGNICNGTTAATCSAQHWVSASYCY